MQLLQIWDLRKKIYGSFNPCFVQDFARNHALYRLTTSKYIINLSATNKLNKGRVGYHVDCWYLRTNSNKIAYENRCKVVFFKSVHPFALISG